MSESFEAARAEGLAEEHEDDTDIQQPEEEAQADFEEEGEEKPEVKATDWEKKAHDKEGQAARERSKRRALEKTNREMSERLERLEAKGGGEANKLADILKELREDDDDPISDLAGLKKLARLLNEREEAETQQDRTQRERQRAVQTIVSTMEDHEADFTADHPDYKDAAKHYRDARREELEEIGYSGNELQSALANDLFGVVRRAIDSGKDPAEAVYNLAKKRGFAAGTDATAKKLAKIGEAAASGQRPSGGKTGGGTLSWGDVSKLKGAARDAAWDKLRQAERRAG